MLKKFFVFAVLALLSEVTAFGAVPAKFSFQLPKEMTPLKGMVRLDHRTRLEGTGLSEDDALAIDLLREDFLPKSIRVVGREQTPIRIEKLLAWPREKDLGPEGYVLEVSPEEGIKVSATSSRGLYFGIAMLIQIASKREGALEIPAVKIYDWPEVRRGQDFIDFFEYPDKVCSVRE